MITKILVLDDIEHNLFSIKSVLKSTNIDVVTTTEPQEALDLLMANDFALVLSDIMMPKINGYEFLRMVRSHEKLKYVPVIFLTAMDKSLENSKMGYSGGAVDFLFKPLDPVILRSKVNVFVSLFEQKEEIKKQREVLTELNEQKDQFLGIATHDLRGPLGVIKHYIEFLEEDQNSQNDELKEFTQAIKISIDSMYALVNDFLDMSVIQSGNIPNRTNERQLRELYKIRRASKPF